MSYYVAFPAALVEELLVLLPPDERAMYTERFEQIACDLVWVTDDADNAVGEALARCQHPSAVTWRHDPARRSELTQALMLGENEALIRTVQEGLEVMAEAILEERLRAGIAPGASLSQKKAGD